MKNIILILTTLLLLNSCEKHTGFRVAGVVIHYPNLNQTSNLNMVRFKDSTSNFIIDTMVIELNEHNSYSALQNIDDDDLKYIFFVESTEYIDTISNFIIKKEDPKSYNEVTYFEYKLNGITRTETEIYIE